MPAAVAAGELMRRGSGRCSRLIARGVTLDARDTGLGWACIRGLVVCDPIINDLFPGCGGNVDDRTCEKISSQ